MKNNFTVYLKTSYTTPFDMTKEEFESISDDSKPPTRDQLIDYLAQRPNPPPPDSDPEEDYSDALDEDGYDMVIVFS